ncbi:MAG: hypothetical protein U0X40_04725 [Ferruginibacter sp.]
MKNFKLAALAFFSLAILFTACKGKSPKELVVNKWKLTEVTGEGAKDMSDQEKKGMTDSLVLELTKDGKINLYGLGSDPAMGTYTVSEDGKSMDFKRTGEDKAEPQQINEVSASKLVITDTKSKMTLTFKAK